jgi:iron complex outermembrane receptor protein
LFVNAKANWQVNTQTRIAVGIDNLFDELAYVAHPWPSRTLFVEGKITF